LHIKNLIKNINSNWNNIELISLGIVFSVILVNALLFKDSPVAVVSAVCGILYTVLAGKGKISCYFFGLAGSGCYSWLSFHNALYGNLALYILYYIPMEIAGILKWKKHLKKNSNEIVKTKLSNKERLILFVLCFIASAIAIYMIKQSGGSSPYMDGITTIFSVTGMYLTVKRCIEQWVIWMIVNGLSFFMWVNLILHGAKTFSTAIMWAFYFFAAIYFFIKWKKEIYNKN